MIRTNLYLKMFSIIVLTIFVGCDTDKSSTDDCSTIAGTPTTASDWVDFVDWDAAERVELISIENSDGSMAYEPDHLEFVAGKPYILTVKQQGSNQEKHYFHTSDFYKSIATRKAQTADAEYKAPYFDDIELVLGGELELYFVPVIGGTYDLWCTITGHQEKGMEMTVDIVCDDNYALDLEVDHHFNTALGSDARRSGSHAVWSTAQEVTLSMIENSPTDFAFDPETLNLNVGTAYKLKIENSAGNSSKHYYTAPEFYQSIVTRKAEDSKAEIKVPYFKAIELLIGGSTELFIVPTVAGTYEVECTITGHVDAGMHGTIVVQ